MTIISPDPDISVKTPPPNGTKSILNAEVLRMVAGIQREFWERRQVILADRETYQSRIDLGDLSAFSPRVSPGENDWTVAPLPERLQYRRVELPSPPSRKRIVHAMSSGADAYVADFDDALSPTWTNVMQGHQNVRDAAFGAINGQPASRTMLFFRPRALYLEEKHCWIGDQQVCASFFDVAIFAFHCARRLIERNESVCLYIPKIESSSEARMWNDMLSYCETCLGLAANAMKATVIIETVPAAFEIDSILFAMRNRSLGLSCGRWDYTFSHIRTFLNHRCFLLPERAQIDSESSMLRSLAEIVATTAKKRGACAIGAMSAYIPKRKQSEDDPEAHARFHREKETEVQQGFDGTWVAHPRLVAECMEIFSRPREKSPIAARVEPVVASVEQHPLLAPPEGTLDIASLRRSIRVSLKYFAAWICGNGATRLDDRMEDTATAEISRSQIWQWLHHSIPVKGIGTVSREILTTMTREEMARLGKETDRDALSKASDALLAAWNDQKFLPSLVKLLYQNIE